MKILVLGGDKRYISLMNTLEVDIDCIGYENINLNQNIHKLSLQDINPSIYDIMILPMLGITQDLQINTLNGPFSIDKDFFKCCKKDCVFYTGIINDTMKDLFGGKNLVRFLADKKVNQANDVLTIEGVLDDIKDKEIEKVTILGFGNLGSKLASILSKYHIKIGTNDKELADVFSNKFFLTTNKEQMKTYFKESDLVINTVPKNIISEDLLQQSNAYILDIASFPYGVPKDTAEKYKNYKLYSSIPSKYAPEKAGKILAKKIKNDLRGLL